MKRLVVVTGASKGIGRETALAFAESGSDLVLASRSADALEEVAVQCRAKGVKVLTAPGDVSDAAHCQDVIRLAADAGHGAYPVLVSNAGAIEVGHIADLSVAQLDRMIGTNFLAPVYLARAALPWMLESGGGHIVHVLSIWATRPLPGGAVYSATKAATHMFAKGLAEEYRRQNIRISNVLPGAVDTPLWDGAEGGPDRADMLPARAVAECIRDMVLSPPDRSYDEVVLMPPKGIL